MKFSKSIRSGITILLAFVFGTVILNAQAPNFPMNPEQAQIIQTDLDNFVEAFELLSTNKDTLEVLNRVYLDRASIGLQEFINRHQLSATLLMRAIRENPDKYRKISDFRLGMSHLQSSYVKVLNRFDEIVPNAMYAPTYLLVGANRGIAQASQYGQLVTITRLMDDTDKLITFIIHELAHFQQAKELGGQQYVAVYSKPNNMLDLCLREGGAEFITHLVIGRTTQEKSLKYLLENEDNLKQKFLADLNMQNSKTWLWESYNQKDYPPLLGYSMGYQICRSLYNNLADNKAAVNQILAIDAPQEFLKKSEYFSNGN